jgi:hypothetical protein
MQHPGIQSVLKAGLSDCRYIFFVMILMPMCCGIKIVSAQLFLTIEQRNNDHTNNDHTNNDHFQELVIDDLLGTHQFTAGEYGRSGAIPS